MEKKKSTLQELQVESFVTTLPKDELSEFKGGTMSIRGTRYNYRVRWTSVDTRAGMENVAEKNGGNTTK